MKKYRIFIVVIFVAGLFYILSSAHAADEKKVLSVYESGLVKGVVLQFEERAEDFGKDAAAVDIGIKLFEKGDYEETDQQMMEQAMQNGVDAFGYPRRSNYYSENAKRLKLEMEKGKADTGHEDTTKSNEASPDQPAAEEKK